MKRLITAAILALPLLASAHEGKCCCADTEYYVKQLTFPADATAQQKVAMSARVVPSDKQLAWQQMELTAFLHFGVNTFTGREWGDGKEDPAIFNPDSLDTDQWVKALKDAGFSMAMLTAKHHDGFCLWPTATTSHSVAASPWLDGKGDVVEMLANSCRKYGMKLGLYLSPWDRNAECYGDSPRYNDMFVAQLTELLTRYGTVDEVWFDGACGEGPNGKRQEYDWQRFKETIETLQPGAVVAIMGDDVRWVGNEKGLGRETEWSVTPFVPGILPEAAEVNKRLGLFPKAPDLGSRTVVEQADKLYWWPSEVDVSIRPGWFYHASEQPRSLRELAHIYVNSVGRNSVLLLNIPPDTHGRIASADVERLKELRRWIDESFTDNLACQSGIGVTATALRPGSEITAVELSEDVTRGQRVERFAIEAFADGRWITVDSATTIGYKRILMFPPVKADSLRINVSESRACPNASVMGVYNVILPAEEAVKMPDGYAMLARDGWQVAPGAEAAIDGDASTLWRSRPGETVLTIDPGRKVTIAGFTLTPRQDEGKEGIVFKYAFEVSDNGTDWREVPTSGEFSNVVNNPLTQYVYFAEPVDARQVRIRSLATADGSPFITVAEMGLIVGK